MLSHDILRQKIFNAGIKLTYSLYPFAYFGQWSKKIAIYSVNNAAKFKVRVGTSDKIIIWEVWKNKDYTTHFDIAPKDIVVDIGAHIGAFSVYAAKKAIKGRVYAFEAYKKNYDLLVQNIALNKLININLFNVAISDKVGAEKFFIEEKNVGGSSLYKKLYSKHSVDVPTLSLKEFFIKNKIKKIDFLKMDVEGAEYKIILNSPPEILRKINKIVMEFHENISTGHNYRELKDYLERAGFHVEVPTSFIVRKFLGQGILRATHHDF